MENGQNRFRTPTMWKLELKRIRQENSWRTSASFTKNNSLENFHNLRMEPVKFQERSRKGTEAFGRSI